MASRRVGYPEVMSWPSVFIRNVSPLFSLEMFRRFGLHINQFALLSYPHDCGPFLFVVKLYANHGMCWVSIMTCARSVFAADAIQSGLNGSQLTRIPIVLVR